MEMRVFVAENEKKLPGENRGRDKDHRAERDHAAGNAGVKPAQFSRALRARECRHEHIGQDIAEHGEDHRQSCERPNFGD